MPTVTVAAAGETVTTSYNTVITPPATVLPGWGVYNGSNGGWDTGDKEYAALVGATPNVGITYYSMVDGELPKAQETYRVGLGTIPQMSLETKGYKTKLSNGQPLVWSWADVAAGKYDTQYTQFAVKLAALDAKVIVCPDHEGDEAINNNHHLGENGAAYALAWLHVQSVIAPIAPKTIWAWWMGGYKASVMQSCYPGDSHVDLVGCDPYRSKSHPAAETAAQTWNSRMQALDRFVGVSVPRAMTETATDVTSAGVPAAVKWWDGVADQATKLGLLYVNFYNRHSDGEWWINPYPDVQAAVKRQIAKMPGPIRL